MNLSLILSVLSSLLHRLRTLSRVAEQTAKHAAEPTSFLVDVDRDGIKSWVLGRWGGEGNHSR